MHPFSTTYPGADQAKRSIPDVFPPRHVLQLFPGESRGSSRADGICNPSGVLWGLLPVKWLEYLHSEAPNLISKRFISTTVWGKIFISNKCKQLSMSGVRVCVVNCVVSTSSVWTQTIYTCSLFFVLSDSSGQSLFNSFQTLPNYKHLTWCRCWALLWQTSVLFLVSCFAVLDASGCIGSI